VEEAPLDAKIVYLFLKTNANFMQTEVYSNVKVLYGYLLEIFEEGRRTKEMHPDLDPRIARNIFIGTMEHIITLWLLRNRSYSLFDKLEETFDLMMNAFTVGAGKPALPSLLATDTPKPSEGAGSKSGARNDFHTKIQGGGRTDGETIV
jgi:hypothetical protein